MSLSPENPPDGVSNSLEAVLPAVDEVSSNAEITRLLIKHRCNLYGYILACVRNTHDAEEVFQEVSVGVVTSFHKLRTPAEFLPWALEIARRQVFSFYRRQKRPILYDSELVGSLAETAARCQWSAEGVDRGQVLQDCLAKLPPKSQEVLRLRYGDSYSGVEQIAEFLGRSVAATYGVLKRLRTIVRECLDRSYAKESAS